MFGQLRKLLVCWILLCSVLMLFLTASHGQTPAPAESSKDQKPQTTQSQKPRPQDQRGTEKSPIHVKVIPSAKSDKEATQERKDRDDRATNERLLIGANILLAIFNALLAGFTAKLWWDSRKNAERQLRAYLFVDGDKELLKDFLVNGSHGGVEIHLLLRNVGKTPAFKLTYGMGAGLYPFQLREELPSPHFPTSNLYLPPSAEINLTCRLNTVWTCEMLDVEPGGTDMRLYVWGEVCYLDAFSNPRFVKFRFTRPRQSGAILECCAEGNEAN